MILSEKVEDSSLDDPSVIEDLHDLSIADLGKEFAFRVEDFDFIFLGDIDCQIDLWRSLKQEALSVVSCELALLSEKDLLIMISF